MTSGVYVIGAPNGEQYVGSSKNVERRFGQHKTQLSQGIHPNPTLRNWAQEFGVDKLSFDLILACDEAELWANEQKLIDERKPSANQRNIVGTKGGEDCIKTAFRCPPVLYAKIVKAAEDERMSINSLIVSRLQKAKDDEEHGIAGKISLSSESVDKIVAIFMSALADAKSA